MRVGNSDIELSWYISHGEWDMIHFNLFRASVSLMGSTDSELSMHVLRE